MNPCMPIRAFLYFSLWASSVVLLGLTGYRIHYTKTLDGGDVLTTRSHFYDPIIVELLVTSSLAILFSMWLITALLARLRGPAGSFISEHIMLWIIWVMFLVGSAIMTHDWLHLKWCRGSFKVCRILETIKAFSWICWIWTFFLIIASLVHMATDHSGVSGGMYGGSERTSPPDVRETGGHQGFVAPINNATATAPA